MTFGTETIYEYTKEVITYWGGKSTPYNDYPLSRFIEDFTALFYRLGETMPDTFYDLSIDLKKFQRDAKKWLALYNTQDGQTPAFYDDEYDTLMSWRNQRTFGSGHLIAGPQLSFFRRNDKVNIVWETDYRLENGIRVWTAKDGSVEMDYAAFKN